MLGPSLVVAIGAIVAIAATLVGGTMQERLNRNRADFIGRREHLRSRHQARIDQMQAASAERHVAWTMLSVAQATDESQDGTIIPTRGIAGTRMAQAVVAAVGTIYGENGPEDVNRYITDNQLPPIIEAARQGHIGAIGTLNQTYERLYESWANENNNVVNMISQLNTDIAQIDMKLIRTRYTANALQIIGLVIALFRDFTA